MAKDGRRSNTLSPFQRFEKLAKALFAIPKKDVDQRKDAERPRKQRTARETS
jgi:hypothetical protein